MAAPGIVEIISVLLGLSGFGVQPNPKAPTADASLQYAMPDADVILHVDAIPLVPANYKVFTALTSNAAIKSSPELSQTVRKLINEAEGARGLAKAATGIDVVTDVYDATLFLRIKDKNARPDFVAAVHGKFSAANINSIARMSGGKTSQVGSGTMLEMGATEPALGVTKDGVLIAGTPALVKERLADTWKAPRSANLTYAAEVLAQKPVYSVMLTLSPAARKVATAELGPQKNLLTDIVTRHKAASFSLFADGLGWTWYEANKAGLDNIELMSLGALELLKAAHIAPRGFAKLALGALDSYKGTDKQIDELIRRKADIQKLVATYTGDGNFVQTVNKDVKAGKLTVRATGKTLSEVVPAGVMFPLAMYGFLFGRGVGSSEPMDQPYPPAKQQLPAPRPAPKAAPAPKTR